MKKQLGFFGNSLLLFCVLCSVVIASWLAYDHYETCRLLKKYKTETKEERILKAKKELERINREEAKIVKKVLDLTEVDSSKKEPNQLLKLFDENYTFDGI